MHELPHLHTKQAVHRHVRMTRPFDETGTAEIEITITRGKKPQATAYTLERAESDWGQAYRMENQENGEVYHLVLDGKNTSCDCPGWCWGQQKGGKGCKHSCAMAALRSRGKLKKGE